MKMALNPSNRPGQASSGRYARNSLEVLGQLVLSHQDHDLYCKYQNEIRTEHSESDPAKSTLRLAADRIEVTLQYGAGMTLVYASRRMRRCGNSCDIVRLVVLSSQRCGGDLNGSRRRMKAPDKSF